MELDKNLIKSNFKKSFLTYEDNAIAQKESAHKLVSLIKGNSYDNVLEIGSYSGYLTRHIIDNINCKRYVAIDIVEESEFAVKKINPKIEFHNCDIEDYTPNTKFDLIISNASLQWCNNLPLVIKKLKDTLTVKGHLALSIFQEDNLIEIKDAFNVSLNYPKMRDIKKMFSKVADIIELDRVLEFDSPSEVLKHLKLTGVNSLGKNLTIPEIRTGLEILERKYHNKITYKTVIIVD